MCGNLTHTDPYGIVLNLSLIFDDFSIFGDFLTIFGEDLSFCLLSSLFIGRFLSGDLETCLDSSLLSGDLRPRESFRCAISGDF